MNVNFRIEAGKTVGGNIPLPASKSICNRVLILNALAYSPYEVQNLSDCDDTEVLWKALHSNDHNFDIKAAGTAMRFLTAFLSKVVGEWTITGTERMKNRPIKLLVEALNSLGARIEYMEKEGFPPLHIFGSALQGGEISLPGGVSSQYISALLMIAPLMEKGLTLHLTGEVISAPYIRLTIELMKQFGVETVWEGATLTVRPQEYRPVPYTVESDWSSASYWYQIAALSEKPDLRLGGLLPCSLQGDSVVTDLFAQLGVHTAFTPEGVRLQKEEIRSKHLEYDFVNAPDLAQTLVVTCALLGVPFRFTGLQSLRIKETDRMAALQNELRKLGYLLTDREDRILEWNGERCTPETDPEIATYEDHRMAMAFAPVALRRPAGLRIAHAEVVSKSYPHFWQGLERAGFKLTAY